MGNKPAATSALSNTAIEIFQAKFPKKDEPRKRTWFSKFGMPESVDGSAYMGKSFADREKTELKAVFSELSKVYGEEEALAMVKINPIVLCAQKSNFAPSLANLSENFGEESARAMVKRNPGLLFLKPYGQFSAETTDTATLVFSYVVAATRPVGPLLQILLLFGLLSPAIEGMTGIPVRTTFLSLFS